MRSVKPATFASKKLCRFSRIIAILYVALATLFVAMTFIAGILPGKYEIALLVIVGIITFFLLPRLFLQRIRKLKKIIATVIAVIFCIVYGIGNYYLIVTAGFFGNIFGTTEKIVYDVVVLESSPYENLNDLEGETIYMLAGGDDTYQEAKQNVLLDGKDVSVEEATESVNINGLCEGLLKSDFKAILITDGNYDIQCNINSSYEEKTRIIYQTTIVRSTDATSDKDVTSEPFNILISGNDNFGEIADTARSDVNIVMSVNPVSKKVLLTTLPRDSYLPLATSGQLDKLTHSGILGIDETIKTVENALDIDIDFYLKADFTAVINLVDALGGIEVVSDYSFTTSGRQNNGYSFTEGVNYLNGEEALAFSRERHAFGDGDFQRGRHQQLVLEAIIKKATSSTAILTRYGSILSSISDYMMTSMPTGDIKALVKMQIDGMPTWSIDKNEVEGTPIRAESYLGGGQVLSVTRLDSEAVLEARKKIYTVTELTDKLNEINQTQGAS